MKVLTRLNFGPNPLWSSCFAAGDVRKGEVFIECSNYLHECILIQSYCFFTPYEQKCWDTLYGRQEGCPFQEQGEVIHQRTGLCFWCLGGLKVGLPKNPTVSFKDLCFMHWGIDIPEQKKNPPQTVSMEIEVYI